MKELIIMLAPFGLVCALIVVFVFYVDINKARWLTDTSKGVSHTNRNKFIKPRKRRLK
jgi:hypothetical protein